MNALYLVRHGESEWNRAGRIQGRRESPLTVAGRAGARRTVATPSARSRRPAAGTAAWPGLY